MAIVQNAEDVHWIDHLEESQEAAVTSMQQLLKVKGLNLEGHDDKTTVARFLKARKWDVPKAIIMYEGMLDFRKTKGLDAPGCSFEFEEKEKVSALYPHFYHKTDKWGRPVYYELLGELKSAELMKVTTVERLVDYHVHCWEHCKRHLMPACTESAGRPIFTTVTILDLKNASMSNFTAAVRTFVAAISKIDQDNYPEHLGQMFIIHAPMLFSGIWRIIKPWLEVRTQKKIQVISCPKQSSARLLDLIGEDNLLDRYGGRSVLHAPYTSHCGPWADIPAFKTKTDDGLAAGDKTNSSESSSDQIDVRYME